MIFTRSHFTKNNSTIHVISVKIQVNLYFQANNHKLPEEALYMIRFHSFYPYHSCDAYRYLSNEKDDSMLKWIREFNKFDLYTKAPDMPDIEELKPYYQVVFY